MSAESIKSPIAPGNSLAPRLIARNCLTDWLTDCNWNVIDSLGLYSWLKLLIPLNIVIIVMATLFSAGTIVHHCLLIIGKKDILVLGEVLTQRLDDTIITAEAEFSINFTKSKRKRCLKSAL